MISAVKSFRQLLDAAKMPGPIRVAVADAAQGLVIETLRKAQGMKLVEPRLVGVPEDIRNAAKKSDWRIADDMIIPTATDSAAAAKTVELVRNGEADAVMKGDIHTDVFMHALLDKERGLRMPGRRVSHVFVMEVPLYSKLLGITDAAVNIAPDLNAKSEILQNAVELFALIGMKRPKVAVISAIETVNPAIASTLDAACLTLMARRGQIQGAIVDGPLAFDNAISAMAAKEKRIDSEVAGDADILLMPDLVSGNILAKNLEYLASAVAAGIVVGLSAPVVLTSRADPPAARLASLALAALMHHRRPKEPPRPVKPETGLICAPQPESACCPLAAR